jgi:hypothetical protein
MKGLFYFCLLLVQFSAHIQHIATAAFCGITSISMCILYHVCLIITSACLLSDELFLRLKRRPGVYQLFIINYYY